MADKIIRPITDVEIVEQMTENDTVLIEQNGEIKRTKGVVGGGEKYILNIAIDMEWNMTFAWQSNPIEYETLKNRLSTYDMPDLICIVASEPDIRTGIEKANYFAVMPEGSETGESILVSIGDLSFLLRPDNTLESW